MGKWKTINGEEIEYSKLEDSHLLNIIRFVERRAKEGVVLTIRLGYATDNDYQEYDERIIFGKKALECFDYKNLLEEAKKRGIGK